MLHPDVGRCEVQIHTHGGVRTIPVAWWRDLGGSVDGHDVSPSRFAIVPCAPGEARSFALITKAPSWCSRAIWIHFGPGRRLEMCAEGALHGLGLRLKRGEVRWYRLDPRMS